MSGVFLIAKLYCIGLFQQYFSHGGLIFIYMNFQAQNRSERIEAEMQKLNEMETEENQG